MRMRRYEHPVRRAVFWLVFLGMLTSAAHAAVDTRRAAVVLRVGERVLRVGELEERLATLPKLQLALMGNDAHRRYLEEVAAIDMLLAQGAEQKQLARDARVAFDIQRAQSDATLRSWSRALGSPASLTDDEVRAYFDAHQDRYNSPERILIWRVLCRTREEAVGVLEQAKKEPTVARFSVLAREHSLDKATNLRNGNLGFVAADGTSSEAGLKTDPALVAAARNVKDGEFVSSPVPEGEHFAVVWRRGTVAKVERSWRELAAQIRETAFRERVENDARKKIAELRQQKVTGVDASLLAWVDVPPVDVTPPKNPPMAK